MPNDCLLAMRRGNRIILRIHLFWGEGVEQWSHARKAWIMVTSFAIFVKIVMLQNGYKTIMLAGSDPDESIVNFNCIARPHSLIMQADHTC